MEPQDTGDSDSEDAVEPEWERQKRRLRRRELIITIVGAIFFLMSLLIPFVTGMHRP